MCAVRLLRWLIRRCPPKCLLTQSNCCAVARRLLLEERRRRRRCCCCCCWRCSRERISRAAVRCSSAHKGSSSGADDEGWEKEHSSGDGDSDSDSHSTAAQARPNEHRLAAAPGATLSSVSPASALWRRRLTLLWPTGWPGGGRLVTLAELRASGWGGAGWGGVGNCFPRNVSSRPEAAAPLLTAAVAGGCDCAANHHQHHCDGPTRLQRRHRNRRTDGRMRRCPAHRAENRTVECCSGGGHRIWCESGRRTKH